MQDSIYDRIHKTLTWKRIIGFNVVLFLILIIPLSVQLAKDSTENRSGASGGEPAPIIPPPNYPIAPPQLQRVSEFFGKPGDTVILLGTNFGDYQWGSHVYVGSAEAMAESIVRWSNTVLEVKVPDSARSGKVYVVINGKQATWDGTLLLYDAAASAKIGLQKISSTEGSIGLTNAAGATRGMLELSYASEPMTITSGPGITIVSQLASADNLGKKVKVTFESSSPLSSTQQVIAQYSYPGIGAVEIIRAELYGANDKLLSVYADPLGVKIIP